MKNQLSKIFSFLFAFVLLCCPILHLFANAVTVTNETIASKLDGAVLSAFDDGTQKVKVYVWINDINQTQINKAVEQKTGLRADNLAVIEENIGNDLAIRITSEADRDSLSTETEKMLQAYLDRTAAQRTQERERTDLYLSTRRAESKAKYNEQSATFLAKNALSSEKVIFNSNYAPMLILELTEQEVKNIALNSEVKSVTLFNEMYFIESVAMETEFDNIEMTRIKSVSGLTGDNVKLGQLEPFRSDGDNFDERYHAVAGLLDESVHAEIVGDVMAGNNGIANESQFYSAGIYTHIVDVELPLGGTIEIPFAAPTAIYTCVESLIAAGVVAINASITATSQDSSVLPYYDDLCKWIDHISVQHGVLFVAAAGNEEDTDLATYRVTAPALAGNAIAVGAYQIVTDENGQQTNQIESYSCYLEDDESVERPDVVSLGRFAFPNENNDMITYAGTSLAAPVVTGLVGLLAELRPSLSAYPHVLKAIVMASCHEKALPAIEEDAAETMTAGLTEKQGAGIVNPYIAVAIASQGTYGFGIYEHDLQTKRIKFLQPIAEAESINVTLTWLRENSIAGTDHVLENNNVNIGELIDMDFHVTSNGSILGRATSTNTSAEMVYAYFDENDNENFQLVIRKFTDSTQDVRFAYAWSVDSIRFQYTQPFEGIGYLKNLNSSYYMEANTTSLTASQQVFDGDTNQMWILYRKQNAATYQLQSSYESIGAFADTSSISTDGVSDISVLLNDDGTYSFIRLQGDVQYILGVSNASTSIDSSVVWQTMGDAIADSQKWFFEVCAFEKGDSDLNGDIDSSDYRYVNRATVNLENPDTIRSYLCDVDGDGNIDSSDARLVSRYMVGLDP